MRRFLSCITLAPALLVAHGSAQPETPPSSNILQYEPWYTGTYLAATAVNVTAIEPFITGYDIYGVYESDWKVKSKETIWSISPELEVIVALTKRIGIEVLGGFVSNFRGSKHSTHILDTMVLLGYQISTDDKDSWVPNCRLSFETIFPSGKHDRLDPSKGGIDISGEGAYFLGPELACSKMFQFPCHFLNIYWSFGYFFPTEAHIKGLSIYGGGRGTKGKIRPGQSLQALLSFEYALNQRWVLAFDSQLLYQRPASHFRGRTITHVGLPSSMQISVAPQIEYNFNAKSGIIIGSWCTVAGYHSRAFASAFFVYLYVF